MGYSILFSIPKRIGPRDTFGEIGNNSGEKQ